MDFYNIGYRYKEWCISPKFKNLKHEIINNKLHAISLKEFKSVLCTAMSYQQTDKLLQKEMI